MAVKSQNYLLQFLLYSSVLTAAAAEDPDVFSASGVSVSLSCRNALHGCRSTTWIYSNHSQSAAEELIQLGEKMKNTERKERLSLREDCSLLITDVTAEDHGSYTCLQYVKIEHEGNEARVHLHVLEVTPSASEVRAGASLTLSCQIRTAFPCKHLSAGAGVPLVWVNQAEELLTDSRYQTSGGNCLTSLTFQLQNEDENTEIKCLIPERNTSVSYRVTFTDSVTSFKPEETPAGTRSTAAAAAQTSDSVSISSSEAPAGTFSLSTARVIVIVAEVSVFAVPTVLLLQIFRLRRADKQKKKLQVEEMEI